MRRTTSIRWTTLGAWALFLAACSGDVPVVETDEWTAVHDTIGDTLVVRTVSGSVWARPAALVPEVSIGVLDGEAAYMLGSIRSLAVAPDGRIYAMDQRPIGLREYAPDGTFIRMVGGEGEGPGEFKQPDGGLAVLSDGRVAVRDPGNSRLSLFSPEGEFLDSWQIRGGFNTGQRMARDHEDNLWTTVLLDPEASVFDWRMGLAQYDSEGTVGDTLPEPDWDYDPPTISGQADGSSSISPVPFSPDEHWAMSPLGYIVAGVSDAYSFTLFRRDAAPVRIESATAPVRVASGEASYARDRATRNMTSNYPGWRWNGPDVPDEKPAYRGLYVGEEGRIWVWLSGEGYEVDNPDFDPAEQDSPRTIWRERAAFDVFEPDGQFLGRVAVPDDFSRYPVPIFDGERVWAVTADELGVQRIVRYSIAFESP